MNSDFSVFIWFFPIFRLFPTFRLFDSTALVYFPPLIWISWTSSFAIKNLFSNMNCTLILYDKLCHNTIVHRWGWREDRNNTFLSGFSKTILSFSTVGCKITQTSLPPHMVWDWGEVIKSVCRTDSSTVESTWIEKNCNTQEWNNLFKYIGE